ncbi:MAG: cytidylate kinase-like family protein [Nitrospirae bacterium YQR-1]
MSIVLVNSPSFSGGENVCKMVANKLQYDYLQDDIIDTVSATYGIDSEKLEKALKHAPSFFGMSLEERIIYLTYFQAVFVKTLLKDNIVYCGGIGHTLVSGISHIFKVYVIADVNERVRRRAANENISEGDALKKIQKDDKEHAKWMKAVLKTDDSNPALYDLTINIGQITEDDAVEFICKAVQSRRFQHMTYSINCLKNLELAYRVKAALIHLDSELTVRVEEDVVYINTKTLDKEKRLAKIKEILKTLDNIKDVHINVLENYMERISLTER